MKELQEALVNLEKDLDLLKKEMSKNKKMGTTVIQNEFGATYEKYQPLFDKNEQYSTEFDRKILNFFIYLKENNQEVFKSEGNILWNMIRAVADSIE